MKRRVSKPYQLELKGRLLGNNNITSCELNRPVVRTSPIKNFRRERKRATIPKARNRERVQAFYDGIISNPYIVPSKELVERFDIKEM